MKSLLCAFKECRKKAAPGLSGSILMNYAEITFPLCLHHWQVVGKLAEEKDHYSGKEIGKLLKMKQILWGKKND